MPHHRGQADIGWKANRHDPRRAMHAGRAGDARNIIAPTDSRGRILCRQYLRDILRAAKIAADPIRSIVTLRDDDPFFVDNPHNTAWGQLLYAKGVLKARKLGSDDEDRTQSPGLVFYRRRERDDPLLRQPRMNHIADRQILSGQDFLKKSPIADIGSLLADPRRSDIGAVGGK